MCILAWICLVATFSGPFVREAEGAEDLARSLAELGRGPLMEEVDGGIGDDSGATILSAKQSATIGLELPGSLGELLAGDRQSIEIVKILPPPVSSLVPFTHPRWPAITPLRHAWPHRFLF